MKIWALLLLSLAPLTLQAQTKTYNGSVYATAVAGACQHGYALIGAGGGAEGLIWKGLSLGAEGYFHSFTDNYRFSTLTIQPGYHFKGKNYNAKWDPFATAGFGLVVANGGTGATANLGAGATYWAKPRLGVRVDGRLAAFSGEAIFRFSIGIAWR